MATANHYLSSPLLFLLSPLLLLLLLLLLFPHTSHSQTSFISLSCSERNASDLAASSANVDAVLADMRRNISSSASHFAAAQRNSGPEPAYAVFQCREYLSPADCLACYAAAAARVRRDCPTSDGSTAYYDGCFIRYENDRDVYNDYTILGRAGRCDEGAAAAGEAAAVNSTVQGLMLELVEAVPDMQRYYAAVRRPVGGGGAAARIYGVAQCVLTLRSGDCRSCLRLAYENIQGCPPAAGATAVDVGCFMRYSNQAFFNETQAVDLDRFIRTSTGGSKQSKAVVFAGAGAGAGVLVLGVLMLAVFLRCRHRRKSKSYVTIAGLSADLRGPESFTYHELNHATGNFGDQNKLGQGGFATVYKGVLRSGKCIAVKKMKLSESDKAKEDFETEMALISNIHHRNLVPLLGCCRKGPDLLFVYEYMEKGSLDRYIFGDKQGTLSWAQRFNIILGTARGLAYLHDDYYVRIIHRDIKSNNILLDENYQPKIADFGLARLLPQDKTHESTRLAGTLGYTAPEYVLSGHLSEKVDTYSFGVVVLETLSGLRSNKVQVEPVTMYLLEWCWRLYESDSLMEMVDKSMDPTEDKEDEVKKVAEIGLMCTQSAAMRPPMSEVVAMLLKERTRLELTRPSFIRQPDVDARSTPSDNASSKSSTSNAVMTFSTFSGRH